MHFTTLFILKNEELKDLSLSVIEDMFCERFCYCCGESKPMYVYWCDWFQIGGRWCDILVAKKGIVGERSWCNKEDTQEEDHYSVVEIKDLTSPINKNQIYAVATLSRIYEDTEEKYHQYIDQINSKSFNGVIALVDCHD